MGRNILTGATRRAGWVGAVRATGAFWDESANATLVKATYDETGLLFPYVPDVVVRSDTAFFGDLPWSALRSRFRGRVSVGATYVGPRPLPYGQRSSDILTIDGSASLVWKMLELSVTSTNLLDSRYREGEFNYVSDFHTQAQPTLVPMRAFAAGPPRMVFVSLGATLGGT